MGGGCGDLATYVYYPGAIPGATDTGASWPEWTALAKRAWFAVAFQQAVESYWAGANQ